MGEGKEEKGGGGRKVKKRRCLPPACACGNSPNNRIRLPTLAPRYLVAANAEYNFEMAVLNLDKYRVGTR